METALAKVAVPLADNRRAFTVGELIPTVALRMLPTLTALLTERQLANCADDKTERQPPTLAQPLDVRVEPSLEKLRMDTALEKVAGPLADNASALTAPLVEALTPAVALRPLPTLIEPLTDRQVASCAEDITERLPPTFAQPVAVTAEPSVLRTRRSS